jgi:hypothetical protein
MAKVTKKTAAKATAAAKQAKTAPMKAAAKKATTKKQLPKELLKSARPAASPHLSILDRLYETISSRRDADPSVSHSARACQGGAEIRRRGGGVPHRGGGRQPPRPHR